MTRIRRARLSLHGLALGPERAAEIARRALAQASTAAPTATGTLGRVSLTVHVPGGASDATIADRVGAALARRLAGKDR